MTFTVVKYINYLLVTKKDSFSLSILKRLHKKFQLDVDDKIEFDDYLDFLEFFVDDYKND